MATPGSPIPGMLANAKAALETAKHGGSTGTKSGHSGFGGSPAPSYSAARTARKAPAPAATPAPTLGTELAAKAENVHQYADAPK
jgi:hypothetical protein